MFRTRDFYLKRVYLNNGKKIGVVEDVYIDFFKGWILGFKVSNHRLFSNKNYVSINDVISIGDDMIVNNIINKEGLCFKDIKNMDVIDEHGSIKGAVEDIIIDREEYSIKGLVISSGLIDKLIKGKEIILINHCILGEEYILYTGNEGIRFKTMPHAMEKNNEFKKV